MELTTLTWAGIAFCITQSAMFSGLNLAFFSLGRLRLEVEADSDPRARRVLEIRRDSNFLLTTILWGNVGVNVLLTLLTDSVLSGVGSFLFSTVMITFFGEITPQAYFSRNALKMASLLAPVLRLYQFVLYPVAKPSALLLDAWLGRETPEFLREHVVREFLMRHIKSEESDLNGVEGIGAANFLAIDEKTVLDEGELLAQASVIPLPTDVDLPRFPEFTANPTDPFLKQVNASGEKWVILTNDQGEPLLAMDADGFLRAVLFEPGPVDPYRYCHRPVIVRNKKQQLGWVIKQLAKGASRAPSGVIEHDLVMVWTDTPRIITGADILDQLLTGVA